MSRLTSLLLTTTCCSPQVQKKGSDSFLALKEVRRGGKEGGGQGGRGEGVSVVR